MFTITKPGIRIVVTLGRWDAYGLTTPRSEFLYQDLLAQGGISNSVPPGTYTYNVTRSGFKMIRSLTPQD